jgi:hypothetical protein
VSGLRHVLLAVAAVAWLGGCAQRAAPREGTVAFGVLGDTPYAEREVRALDALIDQINARPLAFVVHVGDLGSSARTQGCSNEWLDARQRQFQRFRAPFILLPGDNEWTDCAAHGMDPKQRLEEWRRRFCTQPAGLVLERQPGHCENLRWRSQGMVFIGLNVPGGGEPELADARMAATLDWLDQGLAAAEAAQAPRIVVFLHADPRFERVGTHDAYARLRAVLRTHAKWFGERLLLVHGDTHMYRLDEAAPGLRRLEVWGSPIVAWIEVDAARDDLRVSAHW